MDLKDWLGTVIALLVLFASLVAVITPLLENGSPQQSRVAAIAGFIIYLLVTLWFAFIKAKDKPKWRRASLVMLYIFTILFSLWVGSTWPFIPTPPTATRPAASNLVEHFDFETSAAGWEDIVRLDAHWKNPQTIEGAAMLPSNQRERGVAYVLGLNAGGWLNYIVQYANPVQADVIVAHFYLPDTPDIEAKWVGIAAVDGTGGPWLASSGDSIPLGEWVQIVLDLRGKYDSNDVALNVRPLFIQIAYLIKGHSTLQSDTVLVRLDNVAWYKTVGGESARGEQRGAGRTLFDFENESVEGWRVESGRVQIDTITLSSERAYRGQWALKLETQLEGGGDNATVRTMWRGSPPQGCWIAQVYLPDNVPAGTTVWANFFTYSKSGWQGSNAHSLARGVWNTLVWDTHDVDWGTEKDITIGVQIGAEDGSYQGPIYVDDIQLFEN